MKHPDFAQVIAETPSTRTISVATLATVEPHNKNFGRPWAAEAKDSGNSFIDGAWIGRDGKGSRVDVMNPVVGQVYGYGQKARRGAGTVTAYAKWTGMQFVPCTRAGEELPEAAEPNTGKEKIAGYFLAQSAERVADTVTAVLNEIAAKHGITDTATGIMWAWVNSSVESRKGSGYETTSWYFVVRDDYIDVKAKSELLNRYDTRTMKAVYYVQTYPGTDAVAVCEDVTAEVREARKTA